MSCQIPRNIKKLTSQLNQNLQTVTNIGNTTTQTVQFTNFTTGLISSSNIVIGGNVTATNFLGDGTGLTGVALSSDLNDNSSRISVLETGFSAGIGTLEQVVNNGNTTTNVVQFNNIETSFVGAGNVFLSNNLTVSGFYYGDGTQLTGVALSSDLSDNSSRISVLESGTVSTLSDVVNNGNTTTNVVQFSNIETSFVGAGNVFLGNNLTVSGFYYGDGTQLTGVALTSDLSDNSSRISTIESTITVINSNTGINNTNPLHTLDVGSNVSISDTGLNKIYSTGNIYSGENIEALAVIKARILRAEALFLKNQVVVAERPSNVRFTL